MTSIPKHQKWQNHVAGSLSTQNCSYSCFLRGFAALISSFLRFPIIGKTQNKVSNHWKNAGKSFQSLEIVFSCLFLGCSLSVQAQTQILGGEEVENALRITCKADGMRMEAYLDGQWKGQTYSDDKSSMVHYNAGGNFKYTAGYYSGSAMTCTLNSNSSDSVNIREWVSPEVQLTMQTTYNSPSRAAAYTFTISNKSTQVLSEMKFFHGQDTYLGGSDSGGGYWNASGNAVGVRKPDPNKPASLIYQEMGSTSPAPDSYASMGYSSCKGLVEAGALGGTLNTNYTVDNGYALQWNVGTLNPGGVWTVNVSETFKVGGSLTLLSPGTAEIGISTIVTGTVQNAGDVSTTVYVDAALDRSGWTSSIVSSPSFQLAAGASADVRVEVSCPPVISVGEQVELSLVVSNLEDSASAKTMLTGVYYDGVVLIDGVENGAAPLLSANTDFGGYAVGSYVTNIYLLTNAGPESVTITNCALSGDSATFSFSGLSVPLTLAAGETANMSLSYHYDGLGSHAARVLLQDNKPWTQFVMNVEAYTWVISTNSGAKRGGNEVAITNGALGGGADINQVLVGGVNAEVLDQGTNWVSFVVPEQPFSGLVDVAIGSISLGEKTMKDCYYVNPIGSFSSLSPSSGYYTGGTEVVISGTNFCNGSLSDVTNVTFQGVAVDEIISVSGSTQVVVRTAAALPGRATVVIESFTHGRCEFPGAFSYEGPDMKIYGPNRQSIPNNSAPSLTNGSDFGYASVGGSGEISFTIINSNAASLNISSITTNGANPDAFEVMSLSSTTIEQQVASMLRVKVRPSSGGTKSATLIINSDAPDAPFLLNLSCEGVTVSPVQGPLDGGQTVVLSNYTLSGNVTSLKVGGQDAVIQHQGTDWIRFTSPVGVWPGCKDITLVGNSFTNTLTGAYTYSRRGQIFGDYVDDYDNWDTLPAMPTPITPASNLWFAGVGAYDGMIVVAGGSHTGAIQQATYYYDGFAWHTGPDLGEPSAAMAVAAFNNHLYFMGGYTQANGVTPQYGSAYSKNVWTWDGAQMTTNSSLAQDESFFRAGVNARGLFSGGFQRYSGVADVSGDVYAFSGYGKTWNLHDAQPGSGDEAKIYNQAVTELNGDLYLLGGAKYSGNYGIAITNCYTYDGTAWTALPGLPYGLRGGAAGVVTGAVFFAGGRQQDSVTAGGFSNRAYRLDGAGWTEIAPLPGQNEQYGGATLDGRFYVMGPTSYAYPKRTYGLGVSPTNCTATGGVQVTISGRNLCDGTMADVTSVLLAGNEVSSIVSASSTQIVVMAAPGSGAYGDVEVLSATYGRTVASSAFMYSGIGIQVFGADGRQIAAGQAASVASGTDFGLISRGTVLTNWLTITNTGSGAVNFSGVTTNGSSIFRVGADFTLPATLAQGASTNVPVVCDATIGGGMNAVLYFDNDTVGASSNYPVRLYASVYSLSTNAGPYHGGQAITITNGVMGSGTDITNVYFGANAAEITGQGSNWVSVVTPATSAAATYDVAVWSASLGETAFANAYTYREKSWIGSMLYSDGTWVDLGGVPKTVYDMTMDSSGAIYICGSFTKLINGAAVASQVAKYENGIWSPVGTNKFNSSVEVIQCVGDTLYVGGDFTRVDGNDCKYAAMYDGNNWVQPFGNVLNNSVAAMDTDGTNLYLGGKFSGAYQYAAIWDGSTLTDGGGGLPEDLQAILYHNGLLYGGVDGANLAYSVPGAGWTNLTTIVWDDIYSLAAYEDYVYFGGKFDFVNNSSSMTNVGQWTGSVITNMGSSLSQRIYSLATLPNGHIVAGANDVLGTVGRVTTKDNMAVWTGTQWVPCGNEVADLRGTVYSLLPAFDGVYVGGNFRSETAGVSNMSFFAFGITNTVSPKTGSSAGGTRVTIPGHNLGNGSEQDVYKVTICGVEVTNIVSVSSTEIVVDTAAGPGGLGDVAVYTYDYGTIVHSNAFTYSGTGIRVYGSDDVRLNSGAAASVASGTAGAAQPGSVQTNWLTIENPGDTVLNITSVTTNGANPDVFQIELPSSVASGSSNTFAVKFAADSIGHFTGSVTVNSDAAGADGAFVINLSADGYSVSQTEGPWSGGSVVTLSNGVLGAGTDITNVSVNGQTAVITTQGANWVTFVMPESGSAGTASVHIDSESQGSKEFGNVYAYHKGALVGASPDNGLNTGGYQVRLWGTDLHAGTTTDVTRVTFGGADAEVLSVAGTTQVVVQVAGGPFGAQDVKIYSDLCGVTTGNNAFTFTGADIQVLGTNGVTIMTGESASTAKGTDMGQVASAQQVSRLFVITNAGTQVSTIYGIAANGMAAESLSWDADSFPITLNGSEGTNLTVNWTFAGSGMQDVQLVISNSTVGPQSNYVVNMSASVLGLDRSTYSEDGGGYLTISNGTPLGSGTDITNVLFGTDYVTPHAQGENWVKIVIPAGSVGVVSPITVQSFSQGEHTLLDAFQYVPAGQIYGSSWHWTELPGLPKAVSEAVAFELNDFVYAVGGADSGGACTNVYRYDGVQWHERLGLPAARSGGAGAVLNGTFYYCGGQGAGNAETNVFAFDGTNWTEVAGLPEARSDAIAGMVDGRLVLFGGLNDAANATKTTYIFDGTNWSAAADMRLARSSQGGAVLGDRLCAFGGQPDGGSSGTFNQYSFDGTSWGAEAGMPLLVTRMAAASLNMRNYSIGGGPDDMSVTNLVYRYDGVNWEAASVLPENRMNSAASFWRGAVYVMGGIDDVAALCSNVYRLTDGGVSPIEGYPAGGYEVTINGTNLCDGTTNDIASVTLCGTPAEVVHVYGATQIVVTAGAGNVGTGDVVVNSISAGETVAANAFTYKRGVISVIGTNGAIIESGDAPSTANGSDFGSMAVGSTAVTNTFGYFNSGNDTLQMSGIATSGAGAASFTITSFSPSELVPGATGVMTVVCSSLGGNQEASLGFMDNVPIDPFVPVGGHTVCVFRVKSYGLGTGMGVDSISLAFNGTYGAASPAAQTLTLSNTGADALVFSNSIQYGSAGSSWLTVTPAGGSLNGGSDTSLTNAVDINGLNVGSHTATVSVWSATATNSPLTYAVTVTVTRATQTLTWNNPGEQSYTNKTALDGTASSGLSPLYTVLSGPATVDTSVYPPQVAYSSTGVVKITASQSGNMNYDAAAPVTHEWTVTRAAGSIAVTNLSQEYSGSAITVDVVVSPASATYSVTYDGLSAGPTNVGSYEVIALITDPLIYGGVTNTLQITKASQSITFPAIAPQHTNATVGLTATGGGSGNAVTFSLVPGGPGVLDTTNLTFTGVGDVLVKADQASGGNYNAAPTVTNLIRVFSVTPNNGPFVGGNSVTITNGSLGTVTNVVVAQAFLPVNPADSGANWVTFSMPTATNSGLTDITLQSVEYGDILLTAAYTYNPTGYIGFSSVIGGWEQIDSLAVDVEKPLVAANSMGILSVGGYSGTSITNAFLYNGTNWTEVAGYPKTIQNGGAGTLSNVIYTVAGAGNDAGWGRTNVTKWTGSQWEAVAGLPVVMFGNAVATVGDYMYSVGGGNGSGSGYLTNAYRFDGTTWTEFPGIPNGTRYARAAALNGKLYVMGGLVSGASTDAVLCWDGTNWTSAASMPRQLNSGVALTLQNKIYYIAGTPLQTNVYAFDGTSWTETVGIPVATYEHGGAVFDGKMYVIGGYASGGATRVCYRSVVRDASGVEPEMGPFSGGFTVTIKGTNLCNGTLSDVTEVTLAGMTATVQNVYGSTQIVVVADASSFGFGTGDVVVVSTDFGTTTKSDAFSYEKEAQSITFDAIANKTYGSTAFDPVATASSGFSVSYASSDANIATVSVHTIYITGTGTCDIVASQPGNAFYFAAPETTNTLTVTQKVLTVTGTTASNKIYDATTTAWLSGATLQGALSGDDVALANTTTGTFAQATTGTSIAVTTHMTLTGAQAGLYTLSQPSSITADITARELTVTGAVAQSKTYDATTAATLSSGGGLVGVQGSDGITLGNNSTGTFASADVGSVIAVTSYMTISGPKVANYTLTQPTLSADITKADQAITFANPGNQFWTNKVGLSATADSELPVAFDVSSGPALLSDGTNLSFTGYGTVEITATQSGNPNWNMALPVVRQFNALGPEFILLGTNGAVIESSVDFQSANGTDFGEAIIGLDILTNTFHLTNNGTANLTISSIATNGSPSFTLDLTSSVLSVSSVVHIPITFSPQSGGSNTTSFTFSFDGTNSPYTLNVGGTGLGGGIVLATNALSFNATYQSNNPAAQSVTMTNVGLSSFTYTNLLSADWLSTAPNNGTVATNGQTAITNSIDITGLNAGIYSATCSVTAIDATNSPQQIVVSLTVDKASQGITFDNPGSQLTTNETQISATATSGLPVTFTLISGPASLSGPTSPTSLTYTNSGTVVIRASQTGNTNWYEAPAVTQRFTVAKTPQSALVFTPSTPQVFATTNALTTTGGSGTGAISYAVESGAGQIVSTTNLTMLKGTGTVTVVATKASDDIYLSTATTATVSCAKAAQTITFNALSDTFWTNRPILSATASSGMTVHFGITAGPATLSNANTLVMNGYGSVTVQATQTGDDRYNAAQTVSRSFNALGPEFTLLGTNGAVIESSVDFQSANGTDFGEAIIGLQVLTNTFTLTNNGTANLTISEVATNGSPSFTLDLTNSVLSVSDLIDIPITFNPQTGGSNLTSFTFTFDGTNSPYTLNVGGIGLGGGISLSTNQLNYTATYAGENPASQVITMTNVGLSGFTYTNVVSEPWSSVTPNSGTVAKDGFTVITNAIDISALNAGIYVTTNVVRSIDATNSPQEYTVSLTVNKAAQSISNFVTPSSVAFTSTVQLAAQGGGSGLPTTFTVMGPASLSGTNLTFTEVGTVWVTASQAGNSNYLAASTVTNTIIVMPIAPVVNSLTVSNIQMTTALMGADITSTNKAPVQQRGFEWSTNSGLSNAISFSESGAFGTGVYQLTATNLPAGSVVYFRSWVSNSAGQGVTTESNFLTRPPAPILTASTNVQPLQFDANWSSSMSATGYWISAAYDDASFGATSYVPGYSNRWVGNVLTVPVTNLLKAGTSVYIRVSGKNATGTGGWSDTGITLIKSTFTNVSSALTITQGSSYSNYQEGLVYVDYTFCNPTNSHSVLAQPFHLSAPSNELYYLARPEGVEADGTSYVDVSVQFNTQLSGMLMLPGDCVTVTNIPFYFRFLQPQNVDARLWASERESWEAPIAAAQRFSMKPATNYVGQLTVSNDCRLPLTYLVDYNPTAGSVLVLTNGVFTYTPTNGFTGRDDFTFIVQNVDGSSTGLVQILVREMKGLPWLQLLLSE